jgi:anti-sigma factor RsiW
MECQNTQEQLSDFVLAELNESETLRVVRHLASCRPCAREEGDLRKLTHLLGEWDDVELREDIAQHIQRTAQQQLPILRQNAALADAEEMTWHDRWNSLVEAVRNAQSRCAPVAYSWLAAVIVGIFFVLLKQPRQPADPTLIFLAGIWWATVANGLFRLALSSDESSHGSANEGTKSKVDLRATAIAGTAAAAAVASLFLCANLLQVTQLVQQITKSTEVGNYLPVVCFSVASLTIVALSVSALAKMMKHHGRISGTLVGLIYSSVIVPLVYIANQCHLDFVLLLCTVGTIGCAIVGGLLGDLTLNAKLIHRAWR